MLSALRRAEAAALVETAALTRYGIACLSNDEATSDQCWIYVLIKTCSAIKSLCFKVF